MANFIYAKNYNEVLRKLNGEKYFIWGQSNKAMVFFLAAKLAGQEDGFESFVLSDLKRCKYKEPSMVGYAVNDVNWLKEQSDIKKGFIAARPSVIDAELESLLTDLDMELYYIDEETYATEQAYYCHLIQQRVRDNYYVKTDWDYVGCLRLSEKADSNYYMYMPKAYLGIWPDDKWISKPALDDIHERQFGKYEKLFECDDDSFNSKCKIYMAKTAFDRQLQSEVRSENTVVIQGGADLTFERIGQYQDNVGDNISKRNRDYCEMTSVYWAWKNDLESEYIGLCHYRRRFKLTKKMINSMIDNDYDIVTTVPYLENNTVYEEFCTQNWFLDQQEWDLITKAVEKVAPEYIGAWKELAGSSMFIPCNMFIMKRNIFDEYCKMVFSVTEEVDSFYLNQGIQKNNRYLGYIAELLTNVFIMAKKDTLKKAYVDMQILQVV